MISLISQQIRDTVERNIVDFSQSRLKGFFAPFGNYVIKFVNSEWAVHYQAPQQLKISTTPALTWGTATYVTPLAFPLSSALYGRIGLVSDFEPTGWRIFDATQPAARRAYLRWVQSQPSFADLVLTVHSTHANHTMRNIFRTDFKIDCVLFHPDQEAEVHTDRAAHVWMAVTDWSNGFIDNGFSGRFRNARFTVLIDEDFQLRDKANFDLPIRKALRQIERATAVLHAANHQIPIDVPAARLNPNLATRIVDIYNHGGYLHVFIEP